ncbi:MAG: radical SAM family heme chaperone HemW [bacterium]
MAGIYIHIPFCRQKCYYCDFYKTVNTGYTDAFIAALKKEMELRYSFLNDKQIKTIYFGGGTPSVLNEAQLSAVLHKLRSHFNIHPNAEITFEANPDDLSITYLQMLKRTGINRLSIGIQSFQETHLKKMNRRHHAGQSTESVLNAVNAGFNNISADLIYGLPEMSSKQWEASLIKTFSLPVDHLSAYHLTYHKGTPFYTWLKKGTLKELHENESINQFNILMDMAEKAGFEQYEISNFAKNNKYSLHNTSYWNGTVYLGLGPSAHSYNMSIRRWNIAHLDSYIKAVNNNMAFSEEEVLTEIDKFNDYIITGIRTKWGVSLEFAEQNFGTEKAQILEKRIQKYIHSGKVTDKTGIYTITREGLFVSDHIIADLIII